MKLFLPFSPSFTQIQTAARLKQASHPAALIFFTSIILFFFCLLLFFSSFSPNPHRACSCFFRRGAVKDSLSPQLKTGERERQRRNKTNPPTWRPRLAVVSPPPPLYVRCTHRHRLHPPARLTATFFKRCQKQEGILANGG